MDNLLCILGQNFKWVAALKVVKKINFYLILSVEVLSEPHKNNKMRIVLMMRGILTCFVKLLIKNANAFSVV